MLPPLSLRAFSLLWSTESSFSNKKKIGIWIPRAMYQPYKPTDLLRNFKGPGPAVWTGE